MLAPEPYLPPEDVGMKLHLQVWLESMRRRNDEHPCPPEVEEFIQAVTKNLPMFERIGQETTMITGEELILAGTTVIDGKPVKAWRGYPLIVPRMAPVDHYGAMHRAFRKRGKAGLANYCRVHASGPDLQKLLQILDVYVFNEERPEFKKIMEQITGGQR